MERSEGEKLWGRVEVKDRRGVWHFQSLRSSYAASTGYLLGRIQNHLPLPEIKF